MRYWHTSALAPLLVAEATSEVVRSWLGEDRVIATWAWTRVEIASAVERQTREGELSLEQRRAVVSRLDGFSATWHEVVEVLAVRSRAMSVLARHPIRAADAAQLGAALHVQDQLGALLQFVSQDQRLAEAAERERLALVSA